MRSVNQVVARLLANFPGHDKRPDTSAEDWVRILSDEPFASIVEAYERWIRRPGQFAPSLGDFLATVQSHAGMVARVRASLMEPAP